MSSILPLNAAKSTHDYKYKFVFANNQILRLSVAETALKSLLLVVQLFSIPILEKNLTFHLLTKVLQKSPFGTAPINF